MHKGIPFFRGWERGGLSGRRIPQGNGGVLGDRLEGVREIMRCSLKLGRWSVRTRASLWLAQSKKRLQENLWRCKCPAFPSLVPFICVSWQLPSSFFAVLPQSHMEVGLRWVESTTFLLITSKPGDLLWTAWGLALLPPSVNCSSLYYSNSGVQWPPTRCRQGPLSANIVRGSWEILLQPAGRWDTENLLALFLCVGSKRVK